MDTAEQQRYMTDLLRREKAGERATLEIGPYTAMLLIGCAYWAMRQDPWFARYGPAMFERVMDQLRLIFVDDPAGQELIEQHQHNTS